MSEYDELYSDNIFDYDSWEYFEGKLTGKSRLLRGVSNLIKGKIDIGLFIVVYEKIKNDSENYLYYNYTEEGLKMAGLNDEDIKNRK